MSLLISDGIADAQQLSNTIGQRLSDSDFYLFFNLANKYFYTNYKMPTCEKKSDLVLFPRVYEYSLPSDFIGLIQPQRPYDLHTPTFEMRRETDFLNYLHGNIDAIRWDRETPYLLSNFTSGGSSMGIHDCESTSTSGTVAVSGDGSSLSVDEVTFVEGAGAFRFTVTASGGTTTLTFTAIPAFDITDFISLGRFFLDLQCPDSNSAALTSVQLRIGTDASNYYQMTATTRHRGDNLNAGWGLLSFDPASKTTTGTPTDTNIAYMRILITHGVTGVNGTYRLDNIFAAQGTYFRLPYYSKYNVKATGGTYQEKISLSSDTLMCPSDFNEAYLYKMLELAAAIRLRDQAQAAYYARELSPKLRYLRSKYPRQEARLSSTWYHGANTF